MFAVNHLELFNFKLIIVVSPEASVQIDTLVQAAENGKMIFIVAGASDGLAAWAAGSGVPTFSYPMTGVELDKMLAEVRRADAGGIAEDDHYRKIVLGSDIAARIQGQMNAIDQAFSLHHLCHTQNFRKFGYGMDTSNLPSLANVPKKVG